MSQGLSTNRAANLVWNTKKKKTMQCVLGSKKLRNQENPGDSTRGTYAGTHTSVNALLALITMPIQGYSMMMIYIYNKYSAKLQNAISGRVKAYGTSWKQSKDTSYPTLQRQNISTCNKITHLEYLLIKSNR